MMTVTEKYSFHRISIWLTKKFVFSIFLTKCINFFYLFITWNTSLPNAIIQQSLIGHVNYIYRMLGRLLLLISKLTYFPFLFLFSKDLCPIHL